MDEKDPITSSKEGSTAHHLVNGGNLASLIGKDTGHLFSDVWRGRPALAM